MEQCYAVWLTESVRLQADKIYSLLCRYRTFANIYALTHAQVQDIPYLTQRDKQALLQKELLSAQRTLDCCAAQSIGILLFTDSAYPQRLRDIAEPPAVLYYKGILRDFDKGFGIAVVGQRKATLQGRKMAEDMGYQLSKAGYYIISGLAAGIDGGAHRGTVKAGGYTVAVLGTGLDIFYPVENSGLMRELFKVGLVISEYPPGTPGIPTNFPRRNRIVSALSKAVIVVEARLNSGSLITARLALEQGRDLFAVPGGAGTTAHEGTNKLIGKGAAVAVQTPFDVIAYYTADKSELPPTADALHDIDMTIYNGLKAGRAPEELQDILDLSAVQLARRLVALEIRGFVVKTGHGKYEIL